MGQQYEALWGSMGQQYGAPWHHADSCYKSPPRPGCWCSLLRGNMFLGLLIHKPDQPSPEQHTVYTIHTSDLLPVESWPAGHRS